MYKPLPIYAPLLCLLIPANLFAEYFGLISVGSGFRSALIIILFFLAVCALSFLVSRSLARSAMAATVLLFGLLSYSSVLNSVNFAFEALDIESVSVDIDKARWAFLYLAVLVLFYTLILRLAWEPLKLTSILNVVVLLVFCVPLSLIFYKTGYFHQSELGRPMEIAHGKIVERPNVFHIILDGYSNSEMLEKVYGYDNSDFEMRLAELGFAVSSSTSTPYSQTLPVLASMLNMEYLDALASFSDSKLQANDEKLRGQEYRKRLSNSVKNSRVKEIFEGLGYSWVSVNVGYGDVQIRNGKWYSKAEYNGINIYEESLLSKTPLLRIARRFGVRLLDASNRADLDYSLDSHPSTHIGAVTAPFIVYQHVIAPHVPFDVNRDGAPRGDELQGPLKHWVSLRKISSENSDFYKNGYLEKLQYTNGLVLKYVSQIISDIPGEKIILLHGDHGGMLHWDLENFSARCPRDRMFPMFALFSNTEKLDVTLVVNDNLVNVYREIFRQQFEFMLNPLTDKSFYNSWSAPSTFTPLSSLDRGSCNI